MQFKDIGPKLMGAEIAKIVGLAQGYSPTHVHLQTENDHEYIHSV